jgi:adenylate cyclase
LGSEVSGLQVRPRRPHALALLLPVLLLVAWVAASPTVRLWDARLHDQITRALPAASPPTGVVLVDIDEASLAQLGPWPWPRPVLAELAQRLRERGARLQIWDLFLPEPAPGDEALNAAFAGPAGPAGPAGASGGPAAAPDIVIGQVLILDPLVQAPPRLGTPRPSEAAPDLCAPGQALTGHFGTADSLPAARVGHITATPDVDGALRRLPAVLCQGAGRFPQLTLAAAELLQPQASWQVQPGGALLGPAQWLVRGPLRFALDEQRQIPVPYRLPHAQWPALSALQVLEDPRKPPAPATPTGPGGPPSLQGQVVVLGATALGLADTVSTPYHATAPGVSVHAELMAAALDGRWTVAPARPGVYAALLMAALGALLAVALPLLQRQALLAGAGLLAALLPLGLAWAARLHGAAPASYQLPIAAPTLGVLVFAFALGGLHVQAARRQARTLAHHLESFLPSNLAREIARQNPSGESLGRPENGAVLALRVAGLERWSAAVDSLKALGLVHAISSLAEKHARQHGGALQHLQGDTLLLAWPVPSSPGAPAPAHAMQHAVQQAVLAARGLFSELGELLGATETERYPLGLRAAVDTGPYLLAVAGSAASRRSLMLGPAVDVALALLPLCDELASPLLLGQRAAAAQPRLTLHPMGSFLLPDGGQPQTVCRVEP